MKSISVSIILNGILSFVSSFILCFCIFRLLSPAKAFCVIFSAILSAIFCYVVVLKSKDKRTQNNLRSSWTNKTKKLNTYLSSLKNSEIIDLLADLLKNKYQLDIQKCDNYLHTDNMAIFPIFLYEQTTAKDIILTLKNSDIENKKVIIITFYLSPPAVELCSQLKYTLICGGEVTKLFDNSETQAVMEEKKIKQSFSFSKFFKRKMGWKFITYGIFFDLFSLICFYPIYYVVSGTFFMIYGLIALFFGEKPIINSVDLSEIFKS